MPLTYDQLSAITQKKFMPKLVDNIFNSNPLLARAKEKSYDKLDGGSSIMVPLNYAVPTASGWFAGADALNINDSDSITSAEYSWRQLYVSISILRSDELKNSGDSQMISLVKSKMKIAEKQMEDLLGTGLFSNATDPKSIVGLRQICGIANTVGGISQSTYSWWQSNLDSSTTTLSMAALQTQYNLASIGSDAPSVAVTTRSLYNAYYSLLQPQQRFQDSKSASGGFQSLMFNGIPVLIDSHCPASHFFFLNEDYLSLSVHKDEDMRLEPFAKPINQAAKVAKLYWMGAYTSSNNRMHSLLNALTA